jgi:hypothetical protein
LIFDILLVTFFRARLYALHIDRTLTVLILTKWRNWTTPELDVEIVHVHRIMRITGRCFRRAICRIRRSTSAAVFLYAALTFASCILLVLFCLDSFTNYLATLMRRRQFNPATDGGVRFSNVAVKLCWLMMLASTGNEVL